MLLILLNNAVYAAEPVSVDLTVGRVYDNNLYRLPDDVDLQALTGSNHDEDVITRYGIKANLALPFGQQKVTGHAGVVANRFKHNSQLDNEGLDTSVGWEGALNELWQGHAKAQRERTLASFKDYQGTERNIITYHAEEVGLLRQLTPHWSMWGDMLWYSYSRSAQSQQHNDRRSFGGRLGATGRSPAGSEMKISAMSRQIDFPKRSGEVDSVLGDELREDELDVHFKWKLMGNTSADGGLGFERVATSGLADKDYSGGVYNVALNWDREGVLSLRGALWRDIDTRDSTYADFVVRDGVSLSGKWMIRPTLQVRIEKSRQLLNYEGSVASSRDDTLNDASLKLSYMPLRNLDFTLAYSESNRDSNAINNDFSSNIIELGGTIHWK